MMYFQRLALKDIFFFACCLALVLCNQAHGEAIVPISLKGVSPEKRILSWKEIKYRNIIRQEYDYSCGAAALATLITFYFGEKVSEEKIVELILEGKPKDETKKIFRDGFSVLNLKRAAERLGYFASACCLKLKHLKQLRVPIIVLIKAQRYKHYVVLRGIRGNRVYLADPSRGNIRVSIYRFKKQWEEADKKWKRVALAIDKKEISVFLDSLNPPSGPYACPELFTTRFLLMERQ